jgi:hypothetical protein
MDKNQKSRDKYSPQNKLAEKVLREVGFRK